VSPVQQNLQIWTVDALNIIKLIGISYTFAQILGKKISENLKEEKVKIQPCAQPTDLPKTGQVL
jgi:hypothetical protein